MATRVRSYSKINLGLAIGPVRPDGYHALATLYQTLALHDRVTVEARRLESEDASASQGATVGCGAAARASRISLTTNHAQVPTDARNTAWKMVERALARMDVAAEVAVHIEKNLPVQGGMGAGSANAAAALIGLERELGIALPAAERLELAAEVGSDVPLFLVGGTVLGSGHGECVAAMPDLPVIWCVVAMPEVGVSTPRAFQEWDGLCAARTEAKCGGATPARSTGPEPGRDDGAERAELTGDPQLDRLEKLSHVYASVLGALPERSGATPETEQTPDTSGIVRGLYPEKQQGGLEGESSGQGGRLNGLAGNTLLALVRTGIENDFETVVFPQHPLLREIKHELMGVSAGASCIGDPADSSGNALVAALSGSGSALFGLYRCEADARAAQQRVQAAGCKALLTETLPRQQYWRNMFAE